MIYFLISILGILLTLAIVIGIHEFSHFITARLFGVKVLRFSLGFGKPLFRWHDKKNTEYVIAMIPLGGYVKMLDEREGDVPDSELALAYNRQPFYKKFLIVLAGPISNLVSAIFFYWLIFIIGVTSVKPIIGKVDTGSIAAQANVKANSQIIAIDNHETLLWPAVFLRIITHVGDHDTLEMTTKQGTKTQTHTLNLENWVMDKLKPDPLTSLGIQPLKPTINPVITQIKEGSPAARAQFQLNDKILAVNQKKINAWNELLTIITENPNQTLEFQIERHGRKMEISVTLGEQSHGWFQKAGFLGVSPQIIMPDNYLITLKLNSFEALNKAVQEVINFTYFNFILIGKLITGKLSLQSLGGPITIFESAGVALNSGILSFISFLAFFSVSIGILNLLPIPGLDGSHLFIQIIEAITGKPLPDIVLAYLFRFGFIIILFIMIQAFINDILRL